MMGGGATQTPGRGWILQLVSRWEHLRQMIQASKGGSRLRQRLRKIQPLCSIFVTNPHILISGLVEPVLRRMKAV